MNYEINKYTSVSDVNEKENIFKQIKHIFFESSNKEFSSDEEKIKFQNKWLDIYFTKEFLNYIYFAKEGKKVIGYITGCLDSKLFLQQNTILANQYLSYSNLIEKFPAHLHINLTTEARGKGVGRLLLERFCKDLFSLSVCGVHVITSPGSRNISFYENNSFNYSQVSSCGNYLFLGQNINKIG